MIIKEFETDPSDTDRDLIEAQDREYIIMGCPVCATRNKLKAITTTLSMGAGMGIAAWVMTYLAGAYL